MPNQCTVRIGDDMVLMVNQDKALVRISREYRHLMSEATQPQDKLSLGSTAVGYANRAVALQPNDSEAQLAVAIS